MSKTNLPFFSSHRTDFRPGFPHSRAQDVSTHVRNVPSRQILRKLPSAANAGRTSFFNRNSTPDPSCLAGPIQEYRMGIMVPFSRVLPYSADTGSPVSSPVLCMVVEVGGRCPRKCDLKNKYFFKSFSSPNKECTLQFAGQN